MSPKLKTVNTHLWHVSSSDAVCCCTSLLVAKEWAWISPASIRPVAYAGNSHLADGTPDLLPCSRIMELHGERGVLEFCNPAADKVDLTNCNLEVLPAEVAAWHGGAQQLKLANNRLKGLPAELEGMTQLNTVVLDNNMLDEVPQVSVQG